MSIPTIEQFTLHLVESGLMTAEELSAFCSTRDIDIHQDETSGLIKQLVQALKLTPYQAHVLCSETPQPLVLNNYVLLEPLGEGGMGQVFRARHRWMQREVALKTLSKHTHGTSLRRFQREVVAAGRLIHPNIVTAYDAAEAHGIFYLVMEYLDGINLAQLVHRRGPLPLAEALHCLSQAAAGLNYVHQAGIVHRDVKPSNLLITREGTVKLLDLGLAKLDKQRSEESTAGQVVGTMTFMSPEQGLDHQNVDLRSDIYSLGCTLYYLLTGGPPFRGQDHETLRAHREAPIPSLLDINPEWPSGLDAICLRMLAKSPADRYADLESLLDDLRDLEQELHIPIVPRVTRRFSADEDSHQTNVELTDQATVDNNVTPKGSSSDELETTAEHPLHATLLPSLSEVYSLRDLHATAISESEDTLNHLVPISNASLSSESGDQLGPTIRSPDPATQPAWAEFRLVLSLIAFVALLAALAAIGLSTIGSSPWIVVGGFGVLWALCCFTPSSWLQRLDAIAQQTPGLARFYARLRRSFALPGASEPDLD